MVRCLCDRRFGTGDQCGFTLIELLIVVAIVAILTAIALPLYADVQSQARIAKARADVRTLGSAVSVFTAHMGRIPTAAEGLAILTVPSANASGVVAGPFLSVEPPPPAGGTGTTWPGAYGYFPDQAAGGVAVPGSFVVCAGGDSTFVNSSGIMTSCP